MGAHTSAIDADGSDDIRRVLDAIRRVVRVLRVSAVEAERTLGLSAAQLFVLHKLGDEQSISVNELAERTHTHQSSVSVVAQRLVDRGLVRRQASATDGRRVELTITPAGLRKLQTAPAATQERLIESLDNMSRQDRAQIANLLERFVQGTGAGGAVPELFFEEDSKSSRRAQSRRTRRKTNGRSRKHGGHG